MYILSPENCASEGEKNMFLGGKNISHNLTSLEKKCIVNA